MLNCFQMFRSARPTFAALALVALVSPALAQPADRPAAFQSAIAAGQALAPSLVFYEAELKNDDGTWIFDVEFVNSAGTAITEYEILASTFAVRSQEFETATGAKAAEIQAVLQRFSTATVTLSAAFTTASQRVPAGGLLEKVAKEVQSGQGVYDFRYIVPGNRDARVRVNASSGAPTGGDQPGGSLPPSGSITLEQAINQASLATTAGRVLEAEFESDEGKFEVKVINSEGGYVKYEYAAVGGTLLRSETDLKSRSDAAEKRFINQLLNSAAITLPQAIASARAAAAGATPIKAEWELEKALLVAKIVMQDATGLRTFYFDASTGGSTTPPPPTNPAPLPDPLITIQAAITAALAATPGSTALEVEYEIEGGRPFYQVKSILNNPPRLFYSLVDARTGRVWLTNQIPWNSSFRQRILNVFNIINTATISFEAAIANARSSIGGGQITKIELRPNGSGRLVYRIDAIIDTRMFELQVDAGSGDVRPR